MLMTGICKVIMDLIADHGNTVLHANLSGLSELFLRPDTAHRIMGTAKEKELHVLLYNLLLQILKIHFIMTVQKL